MVPRKFESCPIRLGWVAKWSNAVDCKSATTVSQVRILPQPLGHRVLFR